MNGRSFFSQRDREALMHGQDTPPLEEMDLQQLWAEGLLPPEFYSGPTMDQIARPGTTVRRVLENDADIATRLPKSAEADVADRGALGDSYRSVQALNLGAGKVLLAGTKNTMIIQPRGIESLTSVGVMLGYNVQGPELPTDDIFVQALVKWGVGGAQHEALVDVGRGTQLRLSTASFLGVSMNYLPDQSTAPPRTGPQLMGIALAGYGIVPYRNSAARYTQRLGVIPPGANSNIVPIPKFAQSFNVIGELSSIAGCIVTQFPNLINDGNGHQAISVLADTHMESQMFVPNGFRALQLTNNTVTAQKFEIVYSLML
jgi:hypothetical protein